MKYGMEKGSNNCHGFGTLKQDGLYQLCAQTTSKLWAVTVKDELPETHIEEHYECSISIQCTHCYLRFEHKPKVTSGGPRNIALIGHWEEDLCI